MGKRLTFLLGGARSGKSTYAQNLALEREQAAERGQSVVFIATAQAFDDEMRARIAVHRAERPEGWQTIETPRNVGAAVQTDAPTDAAVLLLDCLTLLASNVLLALPDPEDAVAAQAALDVEISGLLEAYGCSEAEWIIVSNEVGLGLVPAYPLGRVYRDVLGRANQRIARAADEVLFLVAGLPMRVK